MGNVSKWSFLTTVVFPDDILRAVARFFCKGGGSIIVSAEGNFSNLEAPKHYFEHLS